MPERLRPFWSKNWGINGTLPLLEIQNFNICVNMPQDILHVLLEGLFGYATCLLLQLCIEDKLFDVNWLNSQLQSFQYSYLDRDNKPEKITWSQIFENVALKQTGVSELTLAYILPFILVKRVHNLTRYYKNYMHLMSIVCLCTSPYATINAAGELQVLVECYLAEFKALYPTLGLKPKHHFLSHMSLQIIHFGPLQNQWLTCYESKNNSFKNFKFKNFTILPLSMAKFHQMRSCHAFMNMTGVNQKSIRTVGILLKKEIIQIYYRITLQLLSMRYNCYWEITHLFYIKEREL